MTKKEADELIAELRRYPELWSLYGKRVQVRLKRFCAEQGVEWKEAA